MRDINDRYGYYFNTFINQVESATLTLKREVGAEEGTISETILFNYHSTPGKYTEVLHSNYKEIAPSIMHTISRIPGKFKRMNYLTGVLAEINGVEVLMREEQGGKLRHAYFKFIDVSDVGLRNQEITLTQDSAQEYLVTLKRYVSMLKDTITGMLHNMETVLEENLPVPENQRPKPEDPTHSIPEKYLDYLIAKNGVGILRSQFQPTENEREGYDHVSYDAETETKVYYEMDYETGEPVEIVQKFSQLILNILYYQWNQYINLLDEHISTLKSTDEIKLYLSLVISRLKYLLAVYKTTEVLHKYNKLESALKSFLRYPYEKYASMCPEPDELISVLLKSSKVLLALPVQQLLPQPKHPKMFRWIKGTPERLNILLHNRLSGNYIQPIDEFQLSAIFSGAHLDQPPAIKWVEVGKNGMVNKVSLLYFFKKLCEGGLIASEFGSPEMLAKLEFIFTDGEGNYLKNWPQSLRGLSQIKNPTQRQKEIDEIVSLLLSESAI